MVMQSLQYANPQQLMSKQNFHSIYLHFLFRVVAGPDECSLIVEGEADELYDLRYDPEDQTKYGIMTCKMESDFVGSFYTNFFFCSTIRICIFSP